MPKIDIKQDEKVPGSVLADGQVSVLVPLFIPYDSSAHGVVLPYTSKEKFQDVWPVTGIEPSDKKSYYMICALLDLGLTVYVKTICTPLVGSEEPNLDVILSKYINEGGYKDLASKTSYDLYFITTGAHPNVFYTPGSEGGVSGCWQTLGNIAAKRGDCVALIELEDDITTDLKGDSDLLDILQKLSPTEEQGNYSACFYPWGKYTIGDQENLIMPGCFGYLSAYANSLSSNAIWMSAAGVTRGYIPGLTELHNELTDSMADYMQGDDSPATGTNCYINPIRTITGVGTRIWGNKTMHKNKNTSYLNYLNVRQLTSALKKRIYLSALNCTFEPNDNITWFNFKNYVNVLLDKMASGRGIDWYSWKKEKCSEKAKIIARLTIKPIESVENFEIHVTLTDAESSATATAEEVI